MTTLAASLLLTALGASPDDASRVSEAVEGHFTRLKSVRVHGIDRPLKSGGLWSADPVGAKAEYLPDGHPVDIDVWFAPPKQRLIKAETRISGGKREVVASQSFFDGERHTLLRPGEKTGMVVQGGSTVSSILEPPIQALGLCYPFTFRTNLADLLSDRSKVTVARAGAVDGKDLWMLEVKPLPEAVKPQHYAPETNKIVLVRVWLTLEPEFIVRKWVLYQEVFKDAVAEARAVYGFPPPSLRLEGYHVIAAFVNCDHRPTRDGAGGKDILLPRRIVHGNGLWSSEFTVSEIMANPREEVGSFRPAIPAGYQVTEHGAKGAASQVSGGAEGEALRVNQISQEAHALMATGDALRSDPGTSWVWYVSLGCFALAFGVAGGLYWRRKRWQQS